MASMNNFNINTMQLQLRLEMDIVELLFYVCVSYKNASN